RDLGGAPGRARPSARRARARPGSRARRRRARPVPLAAGEPVHDPVAALGERDVGERRLDRVRPPAEDARDEGEVLAHAQVTVDGRRLRTARRTSGAGLDAALDVLEEVPAWPCRKRSRARIRVFVVSRSIPLASSLDRLGTETAFEVLARARALEAHGR